VPSAACSNPKGIASSSPGLRGTSYPGITVGTSATLNGLRQGGLTIGEIAGANFLPEVQIALVRTCHDMTSRQEIFSAWAPDASLWSRWAKPVLFAHLDSALSQIPVRESAADLNWAPPPAEKAAFVLDLPGSEGVLNGIALATMGYRPVPLYNAIPLPYGQRLLDPLSNVSVAAVDLLPILSALRTGAAPLAQLNLPADAPPAFLLDANRRGTRKMIPDEFDNRSVSFTTDFPSGTFLYAQGIRQIILLQKATLEPQADLAHTLRRWQDAGLALRRARLDVAEPAQPFEIPKPLWYRAMFQRALAGLGLRRARGGGFGAWVPNSSAGG